MLILIVYGWIVAAILLALLVSAGIRLADRLDPPAREAPADAR